MHVFYHDWWPYSQYDKVAQDSDANDKNFQLLQEV